MKHGPAGTQVLLHRDTRVGIVRDVFEHQGTFFGKFELGDAVRTTVLARSVVAFIAFCIDWNERARGASGRPPSREEFEQHAAVIGPGLWTVVSASTLASIEDAPLFFLGGDISWRVAAALPGGTTCITRA
jgi:hypothetical protein